MPEFRLGRAGHRAALPLLQGGDYMGMDPRMLRAEDVPVLNEHDSPQEQIRVLYDYIFKLHEQLRYILNNLTEGR